MSPAREPASPGVTSGPWPALPELPGVSTGIVDAFRADLPRVIDEMIDVISSEVAEYTRPMDTGFGKQIRAGVTVAMETFMASLTDGTTRLDLSLYEALGRSEMREGRTLDALQSAYRVGARVAWRNVAAGGTAAGAPPAVLFRLAELIFAYIDLLAAASVKGFTAEQTAMAGAAEARRHTLVDLLTRWPPAPAEEVARAALLAGWSPPVTVAAVVVATDAVTLARRLPTGTIGADLDLVGVLLVPDPDGPGRRSRAAEMLARVPSVVGPTVPWAQASRSVLRARDGWALHAREALGSGGSVRTDDHSVALLLAADPALSRDLVTARLAPLALMTPTARERTVSTLRAWLDCHGDVGLTAEQLHVHSQTVRYRLSALREAFGATLDSPVGRLELDLALRAEGLLPPGP